MGSLLHEAGSLGLASWSRGQGVILHAQGHDGSLLPQYA